MRKELEDELINVLMPYVKPEQISDVKMRITMVVGKYDISKTSTELTVYEGDVNERMLQRFLMAKIAKGCTERTIYYYKTDIGRTLQRIGKPYNEITADDIRLYLAERVFRDKVSKTCANNNRRNLSSFYNWLQTEEILLKNPMSKIDPLKTQKQKKKAFTSLELEKIRYACRTARETAAVEVLISTWARASEVIAIKLTDINGNKILVHGKGQKDRDVYINARAQMALEKYMSERKDSNPYLFPRAKYTVSAAKEYTKGGRKSDACEWYKDPKMVNESGHVDRSSFESVIRKIGKRAEVENVHPHRFRRTGATNALRAGMPLINVSKLLGHENVGTTQIYLDISDKELEQMHEKYVT